MTAPVVTARGSAEHAAGRSLQARYDRVVAAEFAAQPLRAAAPLLTPEDLAGLPAPVRRYVERSGALGLPRPQNMRVVFDADMYRRPGQAPMRATSIQYTFFDRPARLFLMKARMFGLPVRALHVYRQEQATFTVRVASLVNMVDLRGDEISAAETVTVLNDLCLMAPGALVDPRLAWAPVDDRTAAVTFANGPHRVACDPRLQRPRRARRLLVRRPAGSQQRTVRPVALVDPRGRVPRRRRLPPDPPRQRGLRPPRWPVHLRDLHAPDIEYDVAGPGPE